MQCSAVQCSAVQCSAVQCSAVQCSAVQWVSIWCRIKRLPGVTGQSYRVRGEKEREEKMGRRLWWPQLFLGWLQTSTRGWGTIRTSPRTRHAPHQSTLAKKSHGMGTNRQTDTQTLRLLDQLGPEGRVGENYWGYQYHTSIILATTSDIVLPSLSCTLSDNLF